MSFAILLASVALAQIPADAPDSLVKARRFAGDLRFEEAMVEYQRYLGDSNRPVKERAAALFDLGFIHHLLADDVNADRRALEALELEPGLSLPADAPQKRVAFLERAKAAFASRPRLELVPRAKGDPASRVRARLGDPAHKVHQVLLRHSLSPTGPFYGLSLRCEADACSGALPPPANVHEFTAWYFLEATDADGNTLAKAGAAESPLQLSVREEDPWFANPWVWGGGAALVVGAAAVIYVAASTSGN
jgi:hypothetical protein